jgi:hypothetical protein
MAPFAVAARRVTVEQLSQVVTSSQGKRDDKIADRLLGMELSERLSASQLASLQSALPGVQSRQALQILADMAEFQDPSPAEIPTQPVPSLEEQRDIAARAIDQVNATIHRLPPLYVTRNADRFEDTPVVVQTTGTDSQSGVFTPSQPLHLTSRTTELVSFRYGEEFILAGSNERSASVSDQVGLSAFGEFGQILSTIFTDLSKGKLEWGRWENGTPKPVAVFRFAVPREASHYQLQFCCVEGQVVEKFTAYHGSITINPEDGSVLRLTLITEPGKNEPITKANLLIDYAQVEFGNIKFSCPMRSVSLSIAPVQFTRQKALPAIGSSVARGNVVNVDRDHPVDMPPQIMLNQAVYEHYSLTRPN